MNASMMPPLRRHGLAKLLWAAALGFSIGSAPAHADDDIICIDPATRKETKLSGTIESESVTQIVIKSGGALRTVKPEDVRDIVYDVSIVFKVDYRVALDHETKGEKAVNRETRQAEFDEALKRYEALHKAATSERARRHVEFKIARVLGLAALDAASVRAAIAKLNEFQRAHPQAWQKQRATQLLAALCVRDGQVDAAKAAYESFAATPRLAPHIVQDCQLAVVRILVQAKRYDAADAKLQEFLRSSPEDGTNRVRAQLLAAECQAAQGHVDDATKAVESLIDGLADSELKAQAYNTLGDCYRAANRAREAMWAYLWVDVIYHSDRQEHARALYHLIKLFDEFKDEKRAAQFRVKLAGPDFVGSEYQRRAAAEK
jgi:tetratricopeptide (TPR) repeat protein